MIIGRGERTREQLINVGLSLWREEGMERVTATRVASLVGMTHGGALYHFSTTDKMRDAIAAQAVRLDDPIIVPQLLAIRHPATQAMTAAQKAHHLSSL